MSIEQRRVFSEQNVVGPLNLAAFRACLSGGWELYHLSVLGMEVTNGDQCLVGRIPPSE